MSIDTLADIKNRVSNLSHQEQLTLIEHLAHELRLAGVSARDAINGEFVAMAADPEIQRELQAIAEEFADAESDGLEDS
jgi:hypothetical protein